MRVRLNAVELEESNTGVFLMGFSDFRKWFTTVTVCRTIRGQNCVRGVCSLPVRRLTRWPAILVLPKYPGERKFTEAHISVLQMPARVRRGAFRAKRRGGGDEDGWIRSASLEHEGGGGLRRQSSLPDAQVDTLDLGATVFAIPKLAAEEGQWTQEAGSLEVVKVLADRRRAPWDSVSVEATLPLAHDDGDAAAVIVPWSFGTIGRAAAGDIVLAQEVGIEVQSGCDVILRQVWLQPSAFVDCALGRVRERGDAWVSLDEQCTGFASLSYDCGVVLVGHNASDRNIKIHVEVNGTFPDDAPSGSNTEGLYFSRGSHETVDILPPRSRMLIQIVTHDPHRLRGLDRDFEDAPSPTEIPPELAGLFHTPSEAADALRAERSRTGRRFARGFTWRTNVNYTTEKSSNRPHIESGTIHSIQMGTFLFPTEKW